MSRNLAKSNFRDFEGISFGYVFYSFFFFLAKHWSTECMQDALPKTNDGPLVETAGLALRKCSRLTSRTGELTARTVRIKLRRDISNGDVSALNVKMMDPLVETAGLALRKCSRLTSRTSGLTARTVKIKLRRDISNGDVSTLKAGLKNKACATTTMFKIAKQIEVKHRNNRLKLRRLCAFVLFLSCQFRWRLSISTIRRTLNIV